MSDASDAISDLQSNWDTLCDLDRARAVCAIHKTGTSLRNSRRPSNAAPLYSVISSKHSELRRKTSSSHAKASSPPTNSSADPERRESPARLGNATHSNSSVPRLSQKGCNAICDWIGAEGLSGPTGAQIIKEARWTLAVNEENKTLPRDAAPPGTPVSEIIRRCRPAEPNTDAINDISWFGGWLSFGPLTR